MDGICGCELDQTLYELAHSYPDVGCLKAFSCLCPSRFNSLQQLSLVSAGFIIQHQRQWLFCLASFIWYSTNSPVSVSHAYTSSENKSMAYIVRQGELNPQQIPVFDVNLILVLYQNKSLPSKELVLGHTTVNPEWIPYYMSPLLAKKQRKPNPSLFVCDIFCQPEGWINFFPQHSLYFWCQSDF